MATTHPTVAEIYAELSDQLHDGFDLEQGLQALLERSYSKGIAPESEQEVLVDLDADGSDATEFNGDDCLMFDPTLYFSMVSVRNTLGGRPIKVIDLRSFHQRPEAGNSRFVDFGRQTVAAAKKRLYRIPTGYLNADGTWYALVRVRPPVVKDAGTPASNTLEVPLLSTQIVHIGLLAVGYEIQGDKDMSAEYWGRFIGEIASLTEVSEGDKEWKVGTDHSFAEEPTNFA